MTKIFIEKNIANNTKSKLDQLGFENKKIIFITDKNIWNNCHKFFDKNFINSVDFVEFENPKANEKYVRKTCNKIKNFDLIVALGSGTIGDICKMASHLEKIPYIIFCSAPSMNGYLSKNASIEINRHKKTINATLPIAVFCDLEILSKSPIRLIKAGIGDVMCFYSCWFDWYLSHKILETNFDNKPFLMLLPKINFFIKNFHKFSIRNIEFIKLLIDMLLISGNGMTIAGGSYPASQSEHIIAHSISMKYPKIAKKNFHGETIAITTITSLEMQNKILQVKFCKKLFDQINENYQISDKEVLKKLKSFFGNQIAQESIIQFREKKKLFLNVDQVKKEKSMLKIQNQLNKITIDIKKIKKIFDHFKIDYRVSKIGISSIQYEECVSYSKFIRNRFTCLDFVNNN